MASKFCAVADVLSLINGNASFVDTGRDGKITAHIKTATALIRAYTRRDWERRTHIEYFNALDIDVLRGIGSSPLQLRLSEFPVVTPLSIALRYSPSGQFDLVEDEPTDRYVYEQAEYGKGVVNVYTSYMEASNRSIRAIYNAGFLPDGSDNDLLLVDENLKQACVQQAAFMYRRQLDGEQGQQQKGNRRGQAQFNMRPTGLIAEAQGLVKSYVKIFTGR